MAENHTTRKRATMQDVADLAKVSKTTVSHVINDTRYVEEETRQRVMNAIARLDYRPNAAARSLTTNRTGNIGMIISDASNLFFGEMLLGVEDVLLSRNYNLILCSTDEILERESHYLDLLLRQRVDGIIAAATSQRWGALAEAEMQHTPIVFVDRAFESMEGPFVGVENEGGAFLGTQHLIAQGQRKIGLIAGHQRLSTMRDRLRGFERALDEAGLYAPGEWIVPCPLSIESGRAAVRHVLSLSNRPTALFISNNLLAVGALLALKDLGLRCPEDISLVCFDDHPWAAVSDPPLTVVRQPARQVGSVAAKILCKLLDGRQLEEQRIILDCELVVRNS